MVLVDVVSVGVTGEGIKEVEEVEVEEVEEVDVLEEVLEEELEDELDEIVKGVDEEVEEVRTRAVGVGMVSEMVDDVVGTVGRITVTMVVGVSTV